MYLTFRMYPTLVSVSGLRKSLCYSPLQAPLQLTTWPAGQAKLCGNAVTPRLL